MLTSPHRPLQRVGKTLFPLSKPRFRNPASSHRDKGQEEQQPAMLPAKQPILALEELVGRLMTMLGDRVFKKKEEEIKCLVLCQGHTNNLTGE